MICLAIIVMVIVVEGQRRDFKVVCYYQDWSYYYKTNYAFTPKDIDPQLCTHLIYTFAKFANDSISLEPFDYKQAIENNGYKEFTERKLLNPALKTMIAIGGYNEGSLRFSNIASDETQRKLFAKNIIKFLRKYNFDGLDIDWQYPASRDYSRPEDRENYVALVKDISSEFEQESFNTGFPILLLTITAPQKINLAIRGFDMENLHRYVNWINVVGYNFHSGYETTVNHYSPLYNVGSEDDNLNLNFTVNYYINAGAAPEKLVIGIGAFGNTYTLTNPDMNAIGSSSEGRGRPGTATQSQGSLSYFEICDLLSSQSSIKFPDDESEYPDVDEGWKIVELFPNAGPYAFKGDQWMCFDDVKIVARKAEYVVENSLGGIMFWAIDNDDYLGKCHGEKFPIINAAKRGLYKNNDSGTSSTSGIDITTSTSVVQKPSSSSTTPEPYIYTVKVEVITPTVSQPVTTTTDSPITLNTSTMEIQKPRPSLPVTSTEKMTTEEPRPTRTNQRNPKTCPTYKYISNDDLVTSISPSPEKPVTDLVTKYVTSKNIQSSQTTEFPIEKKDITFDPSKSGQGFIYINNVFVSNLNLKLNK